MNLEECIGEYKFDAVLKALFAGNSYMLLSKWKHKVVLMILSIVEIEPMMTNEKFPRSFRSWSNGTRTFLKKIFLVKSNSFSSKKVHSRLAVKRSVMFLLGMFYMYAIQFCKEGAPERTKLAFLLSWACRKWEFTTNNGCPAWKFQRTSLHGHDIHSKFL